jgi:hypothetical protein
MIPENFDTSGGYVADHEPNSAPDVSTIQTEAALWRERVAHYLGELVAQAEAGARRTAAGAPGTH